MSRVVVAPADGVIGGCRRLATGRGSIVSGVRHGSERREQSAYVTRALLLWPRLDRGRLRRCGDDPVRIAEVVEARTSQPFEAILAMLHRHVQSLVPSASPADGAPGRRPSERTALRILPSVEREPEGSATDEAELPDLQRA